MNTLSATGSDCNLSGQSGLEPRTLTPSTGHTLLSRKQCGKVRQAQVLQPEDQGSRVPQWRCHPENVSLLVNSISSSVKRG